MHSFIKHLSFLQYFVALILQSLIFLHHSSASAIKLLVFLSDFLSFFFPLLQPLFCLLSLPLQHFSLMHNPYTFFAFTLNLTFMLLQLLFFANKFFTLAVKFLSLSFVGRDISVSEANTFHIASNHIRDTFGLFGAVLLEPTGDHIK